MLKEKALRRRELAQGIEFGKQSAHSGYDSSNRIPNPDIIRVNGKSVDASMQVSEHGFSIDFSAMYKVHSALWYC